MLHDIANALLETIYTVLIASIPVTILGLLISVAHVSFKHQDLYQNNVAAKLLDMIVNTSFKLPYFVLIIAFIPFGKMMANIFQSNIAAIIPIVLATLPVFIHHTSKSLQNTPDALLSMAITNGASKVQLIRNIILQEAKYDIIKAYGTTLIAIVSCSTIAGIVGVQGLGKLLVEKGYRNFEASYVIGIIIALALLNQVISSATNELSKK